jgi:hypothetical protein
LTVLEYGIDTSYAILPGTSNVSATNPAQKPRAKLRDSFITQEIRGSVTRTSKEEALTSRNADRTNALRAIIQKHETITGTVIKEHSKKLRDIETSFFFLIAILLMLSTHN